MNLRLILPVVYCECGVQIVTHPHVIVGTDTLTCVFCAIERGRIGLGHTVAAVQAEGEGWVRRAAPTLAPAEAVALLGRLGARVLG